MANLPCFSALITFPHHLNANWGFDSLPVLNPQTLCFKIRVQRIN